MIVLYRDIRTINDCQTLQDDHAVAKATHSEDDINIPYFKQSFDRAIDWHIEHKYYHELSQPSEWVRYSNSVYNYIGLEMVEIMATKHVPMSRAVFVPSLNEHIDIQEARSFPIILHGDYLTAARARGAQKFKINADSPSNRYEGLVSVSADWHTKLRVLSV